VGKINRVNTVFYGEKYGILGDHLLGQSKTAPMLAAAAHPSGCYGDRNPVDKMEDAWNSPVPSKVGFYFQGEP
jgi:hypothetical protein